MDPLLEICYRRNLDLKRDTSHSIGKEVCGFSFSKEKFSCAKMGVVSRCQLALVEPDYNAVEDGPTGWRRSDIVTRQHSLGMV
jgi:hypothetical protein